MLHLCPYPRKRSLICMILMLIIVGFSTQTVSAAYRGCRADPIVWLSNGESVQMMAHIATDAQDVDRIIYTLHAPMGTSVEKIVYTGGPLSSKEEVVFVADMPLGQYTTDTVVTARGNGIGVTALTNMGRHRGSASGVNGEHLIVNLRLHQ